MAYRNYRLGDLVEQYDEINLNGEFADIDDLKGINSNKYFQECKSNKNDIDLYRYRICRHRMFSYNRATSRNGEKISIALRTGGDCIVSPSYYCFRVKNEEVLCPEYLDIWFKRPLFDRYARFNSWGSATEFFTFDDFCATEIKLPSISEQYKIVHDYQVVMGRIELLRKMNENLEAQAVEMCSNAFPLSDTKNENGIISDICLNIYSGGTPSTSEDEYWDGNLSWLTSGETSNSFVTKTDKHISQAGVDNSSTKLAKAGSTVIASAGQGKTRGQTSLLFIDTYVNQSVIVLLPKKGYEYILFSNLKARYEEMRQLSDLDSIRGSLTTKSIGSLPFKDSGNTELNQKLQYMFDVIKCYAFEIDQLDSLKDMILVKM